MRFRVFRPLGFGHDYSGVNPPGVSPAGSGKVPDVLGRSFLGYLLLSFSYRFFYSFWLDFEAMLKDKSDQKSIKNIGHVSIAFGIVFLKVFGSIWA